MTKRQKYITKTIIRAIDCLLAIAIVVAIVCVTFPTNVQLLFLRADRSSINHMGAVSGWSDYMVECWEANVESVQKVAEASAYGEFMVKTSNFMQFLVVFAQFALCTLFALRAYHCGESVIRRVKNILYHTRRH